MLKKKKGVAYAVNTIMRSVGVRRTVVVAVFRPQEKPHSQMLCRMIIL